MDYKKIIKNKNLRFKILSALKFIPDEIMLHLQYFIKLNRRLNIKQPKRFTEWIQWYKVNYRHPILYRCVDKYEVRKYIEEKGLQEILIYNYGVFDSIEDINFNLLPDKFVIKTTDGSGGENIFICKEKSTLDISAIKKQIASWKDKKNINPGREWAYDGIKSSRIIVDELLELRGRENSEGIPDFKILCFSGKPRFIIYDCERFLYHKRNIYDTEWKRLDVGTDCPHQEGNVPEPQNLDYMLKIASILSKDFPFVRVDLYNINGKIYFGELTFYPWSGYVSFTPDSFDFELGKLFSESIDLFNLS